MEKAIWTKSKGNTVWSPTSYASRYLALTEDEYKQVHQSNPTAYRAVVGI